MTFRKLFAITLVSALSAGASCALEWKSVKTILLLGDSITKHGPKASLGWEGTWGMAATSESNDYVHLLQTRIAKEQGYKPELVFDAKGGGTIDGKLKDTVALGQLRGDLIIVQLGENDRVATESAFKEPYDQLLTIIRKGNPDSRIVCLGVWSPPSGSPKKDRFIRQLCAKHRLPFADLGDAAKNPANLGAASGKWTHAGVNWHPGDGGMQAYADAIWNALQAGEAAIPELVPEPQDTTKSIVVFEEHFQGKETLQRWQPKVGELTKEGNSGAMKITCSDANNSNRIRTILPLESLRGRDVQITAKVRAEGITARPKPYNGVKINLNILNPEGERDYPQARIPEAANLPWTDVQFVCHIPDNTVSVELWIGLEKVAGTAWFEDIRISTLP